MKTVELSSQLNVSEIVQGHWRSLDWKMTPQELLTFTQQSYELGITTLDHADIYGHHVCEKLFGDALAIDKGLRQKLQLVTKCGIKLATDKFPERKLKYYDYSPEYIVSSVETSLSNFGTDYIDLLLLHRPSPFFDPIEIAEVFSTLRQVGKVLEFGVSNFSPAQFEMLNAHLDFNLVTNQVEISPYCLDQFENGNMDFFLQHQIHPMAWSPLGGGKILFPENKKGERLHKKLAEIAEELGVNSIDKLIVSWLLKHPAGIVPIIGTGKIDRVAGAVEAMNVDISLEQWYQIYTASTGKDMP